MSKPAPRPQLGGLFETLGLVSTLLKRLGRHHSDVVDQAAAGVLDVELAEAISNATVRGMRSLAHLETELLTLVSMLASAKCYANMIDAALAKGELLAAVDTGER